MIDSASPDLPADLRLVDDLHLGRPHVIGTYILLGDELALVDPGPTSTLANLEAGLAAHGLAFGDLRVLLLTHIHLDHAGATGTLVARYPQLRVYVHQRGAPHLVAPGRLLQSATRLYGDAMARLWGEVRPVPEQAITALDGGETVRLGGRTLQVFDAPGHATHHVMYFEEASGVAFVGDNGGIHLPSISVVRPATPPPEIDLPAWQHTLDLLHTFDPRLLLLTHFGPISEPATYIEGYRAGLLRWAEFVRSGLASGADEPTQIAQWRAYLDAETGPAVSATDKEAFQQAAPAELCWHGLARYWRKHANA